LHISSQAAATTAALAKKYGADITVVGMCSELCTSQADVGPNNRLLEVLFPSFVRNYF